MSLDNFPFSVCMSVYKNDHPQYFKKAVNSIYSSQTVKPEEIILVVDGPVPEIITDAINELVQEIPILQILELKQNMGHAIARQTGLEAAKNELIAIMDADDIAVPKRFELQLKIFESNPNISVVGGIINEFIDTPENIVGTRVCPEQDNDIKDYLKSRCPMNLVTVMFRKSDIQAVGGYKNWYCEEDYYLWIRLALAGYKFHNINENLVNVRVGQEMYRRRGGVRYFKSEARLQKYMYTNNLISFLRYLYNVLIRFVVQVMLPNSIRGLVFQKFARVKLEE